MIDVSVQIRDLVILAAFRKAVNSRCRSVKFREFFRECDLKIVGYQLIIFPQSPSAEDSCGKRIGILLDEAYKNLGTTSINLRGWIGLEIDRSPRF